MKILFTSFFIFCVGIHVYGLLYPFSSETPVSHLTHILSYGLCCYAVTSTNKARLWLYMTGAVYPFLFHANCAMDTYRQTQQLNQICLLVVFLLPFILGWLKYTTKPVNNTNN